MSYILEALKKAEAERLGATAPVVARAISAVGSRQPPPWRKPWPWAALAALAVTLASAAWWSTKGADSPAVTTGTTPAAPSATRATAAPAPIAIAPAAEEKAIEPPARPKQRVAKKQEKKPAPDDQPHTAPATEAPIATLRELPEQIQREIPALTIGGYIYSANKADRSVLINKRLLREGDEVASGLTLEQMSPSGMVLNYKGYRYRTGYR